jgi:hypothetical protein
MLDQSYRILHNFINVSEDLNVVLDEVSPYLLEDSLKYDWISIAKFLQSFDEITNQLKIPLNRSQCAFINVFFHQRFAFLLKQGFDIIELLDQRYREGLNDSLYAKLARFIILDILYYS